MTKAESALPAEYGPLARELHRRAAKLRQPVNGTFELTERCNLACRMCYVRHPLGDAAQRARELSAAQWLELARQANEGGMAFLLLTGGEPFVRPDFFDIYSPLARMGIFLTLFTNGTLLTDSVAARLAESPPHRTEISLYGATFETYEAVTGVPGSYARCCAGIEAMVKHRIPLGLKSTLTRINVGELEAMRAMARNWGVPFSAACLVTGRRDLAPSEAASCRLSPTQYAELKATDRASDTETTEATLRSGAVGDENNFFCSAGKSSFTVNAAGEMNPCLDLNQPAARPLEIGFPAAWEAVQRFVEEAPPLALECAACDIRHLCFRCPGRSHTETGTLNAPVPYLCAIARARKGLYGRR